MIGVGFVDVLAVGFADVLAVGFAKEFQRRCLSVDLVSGLCGWGRVCFRGVGRVRCGFCSIVKLPGLLFGVDGYAG